MIKQTDIKTGARLPEELNEKVEKYKKETGLSKNSIILMALHSYLKTV